MFNFASIVAFFSSLWDDIFAPLVNDVENLAGEFFKAAAKDAAEQLGAAGLKIVHDAVAAFEDNGGTGSEKFAAAFSKIEADLATSGISVAEHVINASIEAAVSQLNRAKAASKEAEPAPAEPVGEAEAAN